MAIPRAVVVSVNSFKIECFHIFQDEDDHHESRLESACSEHNSKEYTMLKNVLPTTSQVWNITATKILFYTKSNLIQIADSTSQETMEQFIT